MMSSIYAIYDCGIVYECIQYVAYKLGLLSASTLVAQPYPSRPPPPPGRAAIEHGDMKYKLQGYI